MVESISPRKHAGKGLYEIKVEMIEYFPPPKKSAVSTPTGSTAGKTPGGVSGQGADPIAATQQTEIARLLKQAGAP